LSKSWKKYTRSDHRVGEHIADASPRNAEKSRAETPGNKTEYKEDRCEGRMRSQLSVYNRGKRNPASFVPKLLTKATGMLKAKNSANDMR